MKILGLYKKWNVKIGPCLVCRFLRISWSSESDFGNEKMFVMIGNLKVGPGGRGWEIELRAFMKSMQTHSETTRMTGQNVSMCLVL